MTKIALLFNNLGPYHVARCRELLRSEVANPFFIELAATEKLYPWKADKTELGEHLIVLFEEEYEAITRRRLCRAVEHALDALDPDVVVFAGYSEPAMRAAAYWAKRNRKASVMFSESTLVDRKRSAIKEFAKGRWIQSFADTAFVGGKPQKAYLESLGANSGAIWTGYATVDNDYFANVSCPKVDGQADSFIFVGRFAPEKNLEFLIKAYRKYRQRSVAPWRLVMVGDGAERDHLQNISQADLADHITWAGFQHGELRNLYADAGCLVLPSRREPWGLVVNEAMASGLPVLVSSKCGCHQDLVVSGVNGFTFHPENMDELVTLMVEISDQADIQSMGEASRRLIEPFSPAQWAKNLTRAALSAADINKRARYLDDTTNTA